MANLLQKRFSDRTFYVTITDADIGSLKSLNTLFDKYLDYMLVQFEQNRMVQNIQNFELFRKKWLTILERVDAILKDVKNLKTTIFQCYKIYSNPTRVTRLKFAPNMANEKGLYP